MELQKATVDDVLLVTDALVGTTGPEVKGGPNDGKIAGFMVLAQIEVLPATIVAAGRRDGAAVLHLGLTREAALDVARQLTNAAAMLPEE